MAELKCDMCRLCLGSISGCDKILLNNNQYWIESIFHITGLKVVSDPGQFEYLCSQCQSSLDQCVEFRVTCIYNDGVFREMMTGLNHIVDCKFELQNVREECIELKPVDLVDLSDDAEQLERSGVIEPSVERNGGSQKDIQNGTEVFREMMTGSNHIADPVDLGESVVEVSEAFEDVHMLPPAEVEREGESQNGNETGTEPVIRIKDHSVEIKCLQCGSMVNVKNIKKHQQIHHPNLDKFCCPQCLREYASSINLNRHITTCHITMHPIHRLHHKCDECGKVYISPESLNKHHRLAHNREKRTPSAARPFACEYCDKSFKRRKYLPEQQVSSYANAYMRYLTRH